ncbi:MAG: hypothetical protein ACRDDM_08310, partial [Paraclostridium sp.]
DYMAERTKYILDNNEPLIIKDLNITGDFIMSQFNLKPGKIIGEILNFLLEKVLDDSTLNNKNTLLTLTSEYLTNI